MKNKSIKFYLQALEWQLWLRGLSNSDALAEVESHLLESLERGIQQGLSPEQAEQQALERFGPARVVASTFETERSRPMQKILFAIAMITGLFLAYVDSRPTWDDTGVLAGTILLACSLIALSGFQRPWLLALAVGAWIPLYGLLVSHNFGSIQALIVAFVGSYAGWVFRIGIRKTFRLA